MGTSVMKNPANAVAALVVMVVLWGACASGADAALRIRNDLNRTITVFHPPSCIPPCVKGHSCPIACIEGFDVDSGEEEALNPNVSYPLSYLKVQVEDEAGQVYCVPETDLNRLTATALLLVGPGDCGLAFPNSIAAIIVDDSGRYVTCLQLCSA